ncbi:phosphatase PAP2 family protein [Alistipes sp.]|uniref:phosphatase PAP2 family protein n=1 Tax=Alistipes sp. TaxID=1872444 RepID=UPI003AF18D46
MYDFDHNLFLALNFDGGSFVDRAMLVISGTAMWLPLYALILYLVWRRSGWRGVAIFFVLMVAALGLADMVSGIFKHNGLLGGLLPGFEPRWRPMFTPSLEGLDISPDSLRVLRRLTPDSLAAAGLARDWAVHVPVEAVSGRYGTVSAHAATVVALATLSASVIRRRWFTWLIVACTLLICYSRIYLAKHFPTDLLWGALVGLALGYGAWLIYRRLRGRIAAGGPKRA